MTELYYLLADYYFKNKEQVYVPNLFASPLTCKTILYFWKITQGYELFSLHRLLLHCLRHLFVSSIFLMDTLTDRMGVQPIFPTKVSITIDTMLNIDSDIDGYGDGDISCKQTFTSQVLFYCISGKPSNTTWTTWPWFRTGSTPGLGWHWPSQANWSRNSILWVHGLFAFI